MSGYLLTVVNDAQAQAIAGLFRPEETHSVQLRDQRTLVYVSNSGTVMGSGIFQGYAVDHLAESMVFAGAGPDKIPDPSRPVEGSYFTARIEADEIRCGADSFGFVAMAWFSDSGVMAVSDSFFTLMTVRRQLGLPRTPSIETIRGRMWSNSMSLQQLGRETYCEEVRYATPGTELRYRLDTGTTRELPLDLQQYYTGDLESHSEAITQSAERMVRSMKTFAAAGGIVSLGLSGGTDSRLCLAAGLAADIGDALQVASTNNSTAERPNRDFETAVALSEAFDFPLNSSAHHTGTLSRNDLLAGWASTSLGLYDALYMPQFFRDRPVPAFAVGGQGAEVSKGNYGWRPITAINMPPESTAQCHRGLAAIGVDPTDPWGSEWHYLAFRNALHSGRGTTSSDYVARPAAQIPLIGLSRSALNDLPAPKKGMPSIIHDVLIKISPALASHAYDDPKKDVSGGYVRTRLGTLGGQLAVDGLTPYAVHGTAHPARGLLQSHLDIATRAGFTGDLSAKALLPLAAPALAAFDDHISDDIRGHLTSLDPASNARLGAATRPAGAMGKLLALTTLL